VAPDPEPEVSVVVVAHDMARELPRTLRSLSPELQRGITAHEYEVVVVDNGSPVPVDPALIDAFPGRARLLRVDPAPPSPARAANLGIAESRAPIVGLIVDGARMASPGLVAAARAASTGAPTRVIATHGWHLGAVRHGEAAAAGYDQQTEDALLATVGWEDDGYRLFRHSVTANSSARGWLGPLGESSALFLSRGLWERLGGLDEAFELPGGGLVNHDLLRRACALPDSELCVLLGEGTFHQYHGGAATSGRFGWEEMHAEYERLRGEPHRPPEVPIVLFGRVPPDALEHLRDAVDLAIARREKGR
jgi:hypothetical protein